jgi:hypothetical protein
LCLLDRCSTARVISPPLFASFTFLIGSHVFIWANLDHSSPTFAYHIAGMTGMHHHAQLIG